MADASLDVKKFLRARRDRAVGSILGYAEAEVKPVLSASQWESLRRVVLDATNSYHDTVLDLVKAEDAVRNDEVIAMLVRLDQKLTRQSREAAIEAADLAQERRKQEILRSQAEFDEVSDREVEQREAAAQ